jgi:hypothetical protein
VNLEEALPRLLPKAVAWAQEESQKFLERGTPLDPRSTALAQRAGVRAPDRVRVCLVEAMPQPTDQELREAALLAGLLGPDTIGLTLGHAVLMLRGFESDDLLAHELRHVHQYECYGSIAAFLSVYLPQIVQFGYRDAPLEVDARGHRSAC